MTKAAARDNVYDSKALTGRMTGILAIQWLLQSSSIILLDKASERPKTKLQQMMKC